MPSASAASRVQVLIRARDLDTGRLDEDERVIEVRNDEQHRRLGLISVVEQVHPAAQIRSYGDGAATFVGRSALIVAHYGDVVSEVEQVRGVEQPALFDQVA